MGPVNRRKLTARAKQAAFLLAILAAVLLVAELGLRVAGRLLAPDVRVSAVSPDVPASSAFILCAGDSNTYGVGADTLAHAYPRQLQTVLEQRYPGRGIAVLSVAGGGWNTSEVVEHVQRRLDAGGRSPDVLVFLAGTNNRNNLHRCSVILEHKADVPFPDRVLAELQSMQLGKLATVLSYRGRDLVRALVATEAGSPRPFLDARDAEVDRFLETWMENDLGKVARLAADRGARLVVATYAVAGMNAYIRRAAGAIGLPLCDAGAGGGTWNALGWMSKDGTHPNEMGYAKMAERIAGCIEEQRGLDRAGP